MGKSLKQLKCLLVLVMVEKGTQVLRSVSSSKSVYFQVPPSHGSNSNAIGWSPASKQHLTAAKPADPAPITATFFGILEKLPCNFISMESMELRNLRLKEKLDSTVVPRLFYVSTETQPKTENSRKSRSLRDEKPSLFEKQWKIHPLVLVIVENREVLAVLER